MDIKQYLLIYLKILLLQFCFCKDFYTPANIVPVSDNGHNSWLVQYDKKYNHLMTLLQLSIDSTTNLGRSMTSSITLVNLKALIVAKTRWCLLFFRTGAEENAIPTVIIFFLSGRNSTLLMMSPGVQTIDRVKPILRFTQQAVFWRVHLWLPNLRQLCISWQNFHRSPMKKHGKKCFLGR